MRPAGPLAPAPRARADVLDAAAVRAGGERLAGGKALGLARLEAAGARVPAWFAVPAGGFAAHLSHAGVRDAVARGLAALAGRDPARPGDRAAIEETSRAVRAAVLGAPLAAATARLVDEGLAGLGGGPWAVRSSLVGEDSARASHAGQLESFLGLGDPGAVRAAVLACWASAFSARALAYRLRTGEAAGVPRMGVVVQRLVRATASGAVFTADPRTGRRDRCLVSACAGLGDRLMSGEADGDEYEVARDGAEVRARVAGAARVLRRSDVAALCAEAVRLEGALGGPLDLEWARDAGGTWIVQARPVTALPSPGRRIVWDNSNIQESYCGVTTPLTFSFAARAYTTAYAQTMRVVGLSERTVAAHREVLETLLGLVRGRIYYNVESWLRGLLLLPSFRRNKRDLEAMMGLESPVDLVEDEPASAAATLRRLPRAVRTAARLALRFARLGRDVRAFRDRFEAVVGAVDRRALARASLPELAGVLGRLHREVVARWETPIVNDFRVMMATGRVRRLVERAAGDGAPRLLATLLVADGGVASVEPARALLRIARRLDAPLARVVREAAPSEAIARVRADPAAGPALEAWVERYGDRCAGELKLETVTYRDDPAPLVHALRGYLDRPDLDPDRLAAADRAHRDAAEREVAAALGPLDRRRLRRALRAARAAIAAREAMRLARTRLFGVYRDAYRAVGARLREAGCLAEAADVLYLTVDEIDAWMRGTSASADLAGIARARREEFARYGAEDPPNRIETFGPVHADAGAARPAHVLAAADAAVLRGVGCSAGVAVAQVRVVRDPADAGAVAGRILAAVRTDPGWAPLFPAAAGILVERGSALSHSAVVARELGIPAVVGVPGLLRILRDGETVRLDGAAGTVERLSP